MQITVDHLDVNGETLRFAEPITAEVPFVMASIFVKTMT